MAFRQFDEIGIGDLSFLDRFRRAGARHPQHRAPHVLRGRDRLRKDRSERQQEWPNAYFLPTRTQAWARLSGRKDLKRRSSARVCAVFAIECSAPRSRRTIARSSVQRRIAGMISPPHAAEIAFIGRHLVPVMRPELKRTRDAAFEQLGWPVPGRRRQCGAHQVHVRGAIDVAASRIMGHRQIERVLPPIALKGQFFIYGNRPAFFSLPVKTNVPRPVLF